MNRSTRARVALTVGVITPGLLLLAPAPWANAAVGGTSFVSPAAGATVGGNLQVQVQSDAPYVQVSLNYGGIGPYAEAAVVDGQATLTVPSWGMAGPARLSLAECDVDTDVPIASPGSPDLPLSLSCDYENRIHRDVVVSNPAPTWVQPADGSTTSRTLRLSAAAGGGEVRFLVDGQLRSASTGPSPYTVTLDTISWQPATYRVRAVQCSAEAPACDWLAGPAERDVVVPRLLDVTAPSDSIFSPNGDGRQDSTRIRFALNSRTKVSVVVANSSGRTVLGPRLMGTFDRGQREWVWSGRSGSGDRLPGGRYTVTVRGDAPGLADSTTIAIDQGRPVLSQLVLGPNPFYPRTDPGTCYGSAGLDRQSSYACIGYKDATWVAGRTNEPVTARLLVTRYGRTVARNDYSPSCCGSPTFRPRAYYGNPSMPTGPYTLRLLVEDRAGNRSVSRPFEVYASSKVFTQ